MSSSDARQPEQRMIAGEIPALIWRGVGDGPRPVLIYMHGGGQTKWDVDRWAIEQVPAQGVTLLSFDQYLHGERIPTEGKPQERTADRFLTSMERGAQDLFTVLEYLRDDLEIDTDRVGLRGYSHSASVALVALGMGLPVRACLSIAGAGDLVAQFAYIAHRVEMPSGEIAREIAKERDRFMRINPLHHVDAFPPCPIMMIHGLHDVAAPYSSHFALYEALLPHYSGQPGDCLFVTHANGHWTPEGVKELGFGWLLPNLNSGKGED
jgi:dipeptidyl aminopeptidase/acylaminoacyl peptidase